MLFSAPWIVVGFFLCLFINYHPLKIEASLMSVDGCANLWVL